MRKFGEYDRPEGYKNYLLPTTKRFKSHMFYQEKPHELHEQVYKKLKTVATHLERLYPTVTNASNKNIEALIKKNLEILIVDLGQMQGGLHKDHTTFNTTKLKTNQSCINEMREVCDRLQTVSTYESHFQTLGKIKHALHELEHLLQPTMYEKNFEKAHLKVTTAIKEKKVMEPKKRVKAKITATAKKKVAVAKKAKPVKKTTKVVKKAAPKRVVKPKAKKSTKVLVKSKAKTVVKARKKVAPKKKAAHK